MEQYKSPANGRMAIKERCAWRLRIAGSRKVARKKQLGMDVDRYYTECAHCHRMQHIMPNGRMFPHSMRETLSLMRRELSTDVSMRTRRTCGYVRVVMSSMGHRVNVNCLIHSKVSVRIYVLREN